MGYLDNEWGISEFMTTYAYINIEYIDLKREMCLVLRQSTYFYRILYSKTKDFFQDYILRNWKRTL